MALYRLHLFESRQAAFQEDDVLQENIIMHARKETETPARVVISSSNDPSDDAHSWREVDYSQVIDPTDERSYIHIVADELGQQIAERINTFHSTLADLGLTVSTGRVVDFRATKYLRAMPGEDTAPLIYPTHFASGYVSWPKDDSKKPNALVYSPETSNLFVPNEDYVLVKRFSSKEEKRRLVGAIYDASRVAAPAVGFENHLNYYHRNGHGLDMMLARGLAAYLNSTLLDVYFRQFSGHTQVNATDLRNIKYPTLEQLRVLGSQLPDGETVDQDTIDRLLEEELQRMADTPTQDPLPTVRRIAEAKDIIARLGFPAQQQNDRSALTLLALLDLPANKPWSDARQPLRGITQIMDWFAEAYGKRYAPNSRETVRRQTVHQFVEAGLLIPNPDQPDRPINSGETVYMVEDSALELLRSFNSENWEQNVAAYNATRQTLAERYSQERKMTRISVALPSGEGITLSPGGQNVLVKEIIEQFGPRYTPGGKVLYVGDTDKKFALIDRETLAELGVKIDEHGKMPDIILYHVEKGWLILIEAVTSHGPINPKRRGELRGLFADCTVGLVYATAFLDRRTMKEYLPDISWETEVWVADSPDHLIHFDGERFLGPYEE
jgi:adenine-specific DNA-methyltransferase